jgi:hypothetical protein
MDCVTHKVSLLPVDVGFDLRVPWRIVRIPDAARAIVRYLALRYEASATVPVGGCAISCLYLGRCWPNVRPGERLSHT